MTRMFKIVSINLVVAICLAALPAAVPAASSTNFPDSAVKLLVERELTRRGLAMNGMAVSVEDHVVTLSGSVASLAEKDKVGRAAHAAYAVKRVVNNLAVAATIRDEEIAEAVRKSIVTHPNYDVFDWIDGEVNGANVKLYGFVREPWRKDEFEKRVQAIRGVVNIENQIEVLPLSNYDDRLRIAAVRLIYGNSTLSKYALGANPSIHIVVDRGRVVLKGMVANSFDRQIAEAAVRGSLLAFDIKNELTVDTGL